MIHKYVYSLPFYHLIPNFGEAKAETEVFGIPGSIDVVWNIFAAHHQL